MADLYDVIGQETVTEFVPPQTTRQKHQVTAVAKPSGVVFVTRVASADWNANNLGLILHDLAVYMNKLAARPGVVSVDEQQDVNANNQLTNSFLVTVESSSGDGSADVRLTYGEAFGSDGYAKIQAARDKLDAIEEL